MKKDLFSTKTIVATGLGAALFLVLFMFVKIPSPIPETNIQVAYGVSAFFGALFGPVAGFLIAFVGHALNDFLAYGSCWWSWIIASGVSGLVSGLVFYKMDLAHGQKPNSWFFILNVVGQVVAWMLVAPGLDVLMYGEPAGLVFVQGITACIINLVATVGVGALLCYAYAATRTEKGSLDAE